MTGVVSRKIGVIETNKKQETCSEDCYGKIFWRGDWALKDETVDKYPEEHSRQKEEQ